MMTLPGQMTKILTLAMEKIADNVMITDVHGTIEYVNPAFETTTGYSRQEVIGLTPKILRSGRHDAVYYAELWRTILAGKVFRATVANKKKTGEIYYADQTISPVQDEAGGIVCFVAVWKDITERIKAEERLKSEKAKLEQVLSTEAGLHSIRDLHQLIDFVVKKTCDVLGVQKCSLMFIDHESKALCIRGHLGIDESQVRRNLFKLGDPWSDIMVKCHGINGRPDSANARIDGMIYQTKSFLSVPIELKDHLLGMINVSHKKTNSDGLFNDMDRKILMMIVHQTRMAVENAQLYRQLKYMTTSDVLTGVYNHHYFIQTLDAEIVRSKYYRRDLSILMLDIDHFKAYNDRFGVPAGDRILKSVAKTIKDAVQTTDIVCRYGSDEFAVILPETDFEHARIMGEKIRAKVYDLSADPRVTVSVGLCECASTNDRHDMVQRANCSLYEAKCHGRNQVSGQKTGGG